jgi:hypothetical protein
MRLVSVVNRFLVVFAVIAILSQLSFAAEDEYIKWYGVGGELNDPRRWLGRVGVSEYLAVETLFAMEHISGDCDQGKAECDFTRLDVGVGLIYDIVPNSKISPYLAGRFILRMTGNGESETSGTIESAGGVEYVIMKRLGLSGELNFRFHTDPTEVITTTIIRFYFYL